MDREIYDIDKAPPELSNEEAHVWLRGYNAAISKPHELKPDPYGISVAHTWAEVGVLLDLVNRYHVTRFVELGMHVGGLTSVLYPFLLHKPGFRYLGIEIDEGLVTDTVKSLPEMSFLWGDCLSMDVRRQVELFTKSTPSISFVYCDNGNKPKEFEAYAPILRPHDIIAAHDYGTEIFKNDVMPVVAKFGLEPIVVDEPTRITVWRKA